MTSPLGSTTQRTGIADSWTCLGLSLKKKNQTRENLWLITKTEGRRCHTGDALGRQGSELDSCAYPTDEQVISHPWGRWVPLRQGLSLVQLGMMAEAEAVKMWIEIPPGCRGPQELGSWNSALAEAEVVILGGSREALPACSPVTIHAGIQWLSMLWLQPITRESQQKLEPLQRQDCSEAQVCSWHRLLWHPDIPVQSPALDTLMMKMVSIPGGPGTWAW